MQEEKVFKWFKEQINTSQELAKGSEPSRMVDEDLCGSQPFLGSTTQIKVDVGFANDTGSDGHFRYDWSQILVPGELKRNPNTDRNTSTWPDPARYARGVLTTQDTRRFTQAFTLCGPVMRLLGI